jgi:SET domain-containing protein
LFLQHSCEPNLVSQTVFVDTHNPRLHQVCLFTARLVQAGEELCWDYAYEPWDPDFQYKNAKFMDCNCGARNCLKRLKLCGM